MSDILIVDFGGPIERRVSGLEGCHVADPDFRCLGGLGGWRSEMLGIDFGGPIEEKVSGLEGCHVAILYCLRLGRLGTRDFNTLDALKRSARLGKLGCRTCRRC